MSQLYDLKLLIENKIKADGLDGNAVRGRIGLQSGRMLLLIDPNSKDDPAGRCQTQAGYQRSAEYQRVRSDP